MTREPDSSSFDAIVAAWRAEGNVPQWPDDPHLDEPAADARTGVGTDARADDAAEYDDAADDPAGSRSDDAGGRYGGNAADDISGTDVGLGGSGSDGTVGRRSDTDDAAGGRSDTARRPPSDPRTDPHHRRGDAARADPGRTDASRADPEHADLGHPDPSHPDPGSADASSADADRVDTGSADFGHPYFGHADASRADRGLAEPDQANADPGSPGPHPRAEDAAERGAANGERQPARAGAAADPNADEHFLPPEPPPLPRMGPPILVGLTLILLGLVLVTFPGWVGVPQVYGLPLGLVAIAAGLGWLVLRLWPDPDDVPPPLYLDDPDDPDGGAVL